MRIARAYPTCIAQNRHHLFEPFPLFNIHNMKTRTASIALQLITAVLSIFLRNVAATGGNGPLLGIPVPGQTVSALEVFKFFDNMCRPQMNPYEQRPSITNSLKFLSNSRGEELAQRAYSSLYFAVGEVHVSKLMGKWFKVITSPRVHKETCLVSYYKPISDSEFTATFSTRNYFRSGTTVDMHQGFGTKIGPDAGQLLINTGHPADPCPYTVVKTGPVNKAGEYSYVVLTQLLKHPIIGLARDPYEFDREYKTEVVDFLKRHNFNNPLTAYNKITFANWTKCPDEYYRHL